MNAELPPFKMGNNSASVPTLERDITLSTGVFACSFLVTQDGKVFACGEATNGRLGLGLSTGNVSIPKQLTSLSQYVIKKVAVSSQHYQG